MSQSNARQMISDLFQLPLKELLEKAGIVHREHHSTNEVQLSSLLSIKTGGCPENCSYCPQSSHYKTGLDRKRLMDLKSVTAAAEKAKQSGATRFCMGAAWREVKEGPDFESVLEMVRSVREMGLEVCCTLGMINDSQAQRLKTAGLHSYNHNIDTSRTHYSKIISTRTYDDRLRTIENVRRAGLSVCTGGIIGMGETVDDRIDFLLQLSSFVPHPESVTINALIPISGTPLEEQTTASPLELARVIATARCLMPNSMIRLSAGRKGMSDEGQFLCLLAGANSIFLGDTLLTSANPAAYSDFELLSRVGMQAARVKPAVVHRQ